MLSNGLNLSGVVIDLNFESPIQPAVSSRGRRHEQWTEPVCTTHQSLAPARVSPVCGTICWQLPGTKFLLLGSVSLHDLRAVELPGKSARHRGLSAFARTPVVSSGNPRPDFAQHAGRRQRVARLADLRRLCSGIDWGSTPTLSPRRLGDRAGQHRLRAGLDHHRSVHRVVSLGLFQTHAARSEVAHAAGLARTYSGFPAHYAGTSARCQ